MASLTEEIADALAQDVIRAAKELGDDNLVNEVSRVIGASSTTTQEAFMTAVRVRLSEQRARQLLAERLGPRQADPTAEAQVVPVQAVPAQPAAPVAEVPEATPSKPARERPPWSGPQPAPAAAPTAFIPGLAEPPQPALAPPRPTPQEEGPSQAAAPGVKPRMFVKRQKPTIGPQDTATTSPSPESPAAALALDAALAGRVTAPSDPKPTEPLSYPDIEIPDGDWG